MSYQEDEEKYLAYIAEAYYFNGSAKIVFMARFREKNKDIKHDSLSEAINCPYQTVIDQLNRTIIPRFQKSGCDTSTVNKHDRWRCCLTWLQAEKYNEWLQRDSRDNRVVNSPSESESLRTITETNTASLVQAKCIKIKDKIEYLCGSFQVLGMNNSKELRKIYTTVTISETIRSKHLKKGIGSIILQDNQRHALMQVLTEKISGLDAVYNHQRVMLLGKLGGGKTTFLNYLALEALEKECPDMTCSNTNDDQEEYCLKNQCKTKEWLREFVPIFVRVRDFARNFEDSATNSNLLNLFNYIVYEFKLDPENFRHILNAGKVIVLLDGLDEVNNFNKNRVLDEIQKFVDEFNKNRFVASCRVNSLERQFTGFTDIEINDFDDRQISNFVICWFEAEKQPEIAKRFLREIKYDQNKSIRDLASTPLFLTLLCITFTDWGFTENRLELYDNCVDVLLKKWDAARGVVGRHQASSLGQKGKKKKLLSKIAYPNFYNNIYYFDRSEIIKQISNYVKNIPRIDLDNVEEESEDVLNSFEVSHGLLVQQYVNVYSFAHLSFQEYFTAQFIKDNCNQFSLDDENLINLVEHLTEPRWREVFKLVAEMLDNSDCLMQLAKKRIDKLLLTPKLQRFLNWVNEKSISHAVVMTNYNNLAAIRANYFDFDIALDQDRKLGCILDNDFTISFTCASFLARAQNNEIRDNFSIVSIDSESDLEPAMAVIIARTDAINELLKESNLDLHLKNDLQSLQNEIYPILKNREINKEIFDLWCQENGQNWGDKLRKIIVPFRSLGDSWRYKVVDGNQPQSPDVFSELEEELLRRYYEANLLLVSCLNSESVFTNRDVREEIIKSLLLPIPQDE